MCCSRAGAPLARLGGAPSQLQLQALSAAVLVSPTLTNPSSSSSGATRAATWPVRLCEAVEAVEAVEAAEEAEEAEAASPHPKRIMSVPRQESAVVGSRNTKTSRAHEKESSLSARICAQGGAGGGV